MMRATLLTAWNALLAGDTGAGDEVVGCTVEGLGEPAAGDCFGVGDPATVDGDEGDGVAGGEEEEGEGVEGDGDEVGLEGPDPGAPAARPPCTQPSHSFI